MSESILGISAYYHDSAATLLVDGEIIAAAHEERFSRKKHDAGFPLRSVEYVLREAGLGIEDLTAVAFYDKPYLKFERLMETFHATAPGCYPSFLKAAPVWIKEKLFTKQNIQRKLVSVANKGGRVPPLFFPEHHLSHAAGAFYPSPFDSAAILTIDGVGEWSTTTIGKGDSEGLTILKELHFPHSLGLLYSAFTYYCGFRVNSGEYKLMGLAPYGSPGQADEYERKIREELVCLAEDGSVGLNMSYFAFTTGLRMCRDKKWNKLFGISKRSPETEISQKYMDLALAIQRFTEEAVLRLARTARELTGMKNCVLAGGVALNCVANGKLLRSGIFEDIWIQPAAGDAGGALGAAYAVSCIGFRRNRFPCDGKYDRMKGAYLGPEYTERDIKNALRRYDAPFRSFGGFDELCTNVVSLLEKGCVVGWFQGRMEWGPRALGNRSILGDPRHPEMQKKLNLKIKYREGFRPFAPAVLAQDASTYFNTIETSPYMQYVASVKEEVRNELPRNYENLSMLERLYVIRSSVPAVTHVDFTARLQTVHKETNERFYRLLEIFKEHSGCPVLVNTSFNVRGEPIVCTPEDAYRCFMRTEMDFVVLGNCLLSKSDQSVLENDNWWQDEFVLD